MEFQHLFNKSKHRDLPTHSPLNHIISSVRVLQITALHTQILVDGVLDEHSKVQRYRCKSDIALFAWTGT